MRRTGSKARPLMRVSRKLSATVLLLACAAIQPACKNGFTAQGGSAPSASEASKKFWDRCIGTQCPPMNSDEDAPKRKEN